MKKLSSFVFISVLMLNIMGYYGAFFGLHYQNDRAMTKALDTHSYDESQAVTIRIPVSIPYTSDQLHFEKVEGKFTHGGELYRLVKQKYAQDTLTIVCVRDTEYKKINQVLSEYAKTVTDQTDSDAAKITVSFLKDYLPIAFSIHSVSSGWSVHLSANSRSKILLSAFSSSIVHPPERA